VASSHPTILLVADNPDTLEMYSVGLSFAGFRLLTTTRPEDVPSHLRRARPDAVVTDLVFSGSHTGWDLVNALKNDPTTRDIPVVVLSGDVDPSVSLKAAQSGCHAVLTKPCVPDELAQVLLRACAPTQRRTERTV
jgi:CheY-like chemotaxis protein